MAGHRMQRRLTAWNFELIGKIDPQRSPDGAVCEFFPQSRYANAKDLPLNGHGAGPFCKFRIGLSEHRQGVYALTADDETVYVGECEDLSRRFGPRGYGNISPRNCFQGGQATNCKVNHLILNAVKSGHLVRLWFLPMTDRKTVEAMLIRFYHPAWNGQTPKPC
jgi:hypothetical protein